MTVRIFDQAKASDLDYEDLLSLFRSATTESDYMATGEITDLQTLEKVLYNKNLIHFFAYEGNLPVAYCQVTYKADSKNFNSGAKINALAVLPEQRGKGLGKQLLKEVIVTLQKNPTIKNIYLDVVKDNTVAVNLYTELGFQKTGELKSLFTKNGALLDIEIYSLLTTQE
jgi:ribosomal protein S18 acetylase RimI-like enzyme